MFKLWSHGVATHAITISFSHVTLDVRTISCMATEVWSLALTRERGVECRETLRIFAHSSVRPSIMTYDLGIVHALAPICDLSWSVIAVLLMSYCRRVERWTIPASPGWSCRKIWGWTLGSWCSLSTWFASQLRSPRIMSSWPWLNRDRGPCVVVPLPSMRYCATTPLVRRTKIVL